MCRTFGALSLDCPENCGRLGILRDVAKLRLYVQGLLNPHESYLSQGKPKGPRENSLSLHLLSKHPRGSSLAVAGAPFSARNDRGLESPRSTSLRDIAGKQKLKLKGDTAHCK